MPKKKKFVQVRMYNVGFGDCFLVTVPASDGKPRKILFDCGSVAAAPKLPMEDVLKQLWTDVEGRIDVVVATHRHRDHVSGFAKEGWEDVEVGEVWMPWTEHPTDPEARRIRETQARLAFHLQLALGARANADASLQLALNALSNERAMTVLHEGFKGSPKRRFFPPEDPAKFRLEMETVLPGISVFVLGPSKTESVIRDMDPPAGKSYMHLVGSCDQGKAPAPFGEEWRLEPQQYAIGVVDQSVPFLDKVKQWWGNKVERPLPVMTEADRAAIDAAGEAELLAAAALDKAVNGTSLMLMLKAGSAHLLFPGDAQWGTWQAAMGDAGTRDLLEKTRFYKVGHHGSHNATPTEFVETLLPEGALGMVSTRTVAQWPEIPRGPLLDALTDRKCDWARSDDPARSDAKKFKASGKVWVETKIPVD